MTNMLLALPEMTLAVAAMALLLIGAFCGDTAARRVTAAGVVGLLATLVLVAIGDTKGVAFSGMFAVDDFRRFIKIAVLAAGAGCLGLAPAFWERDGGHKADYPVLVMLAVLGMMLMVSASDWVALYVGLEMQNLALYVLVSFKRDDKRSSEAGLKYFMLSAFSSAILLFGISLLYGFAGGTGFAATAQAIAQHEGLSPGLAIGIVFVLAGFAFKVSATPFHMWTPDVYEGAPTPVTAFLAAAPKVAALALLGVVLASPLAQTSALWRPVVVVLAVSSMVLGAFAGLMQTHIKRLMAYSAIANVGTVLVGFVCLDPVSRLMTIDGLQGSILYLALYFVGVIGVFSVMLAVRKNGKAVEEIKDFAGLGQSHPALALAMAAALFSLAGVPPLAGFFGKYFVLLAAVKVDLWPMALVGALTSVVAAAYYLRIVKIMYFDSPQGEPFDSVDDKALWAVVALAGLSVVLFILAPAPLLEASRQAAESLLVP